MSYLLFYEEDARGYDRLDAETSATELEQACHAMADEDNRIEALIAARQQQLTQRACAKCDKLNPPYNELCPVLSPEGKTTLHVFRVNIDVARAKPHVQTLAPAAP